MALHRIRPFVMGVLSLGLFGLGAGCAASDDATAESQLNTTSTHLLALSSYSASLGTPIEAYFSNPPPSDARSIELVFDGTFTRAGGGTEQVSFTQPMDRIEAGAARWTSFGPFSNPFTPKKPDIGVFNGKVGVKVTLANGSTTMDGNPMPVRFEVKPSIIVTELQPTTATCGQPALRLIGAMSYKLKATTIGFKATSIEYTFQTPSVVPDEKGKPALDVAPNGEPNYRSTRLGHDMTSNTDTVGGKEAIVLPPVPMDRPSYGVVIAIVAKDDQGRKISSVFGMTAHRPIEVFNDGRFELAQVYAAKPVSGCIPGGQQGRAAAYTESTTETRSRQVSLTLSQSWLKSEENNWSTSDGKTVTKSTTNTDGYSKTHGTQNSFSFTRSSSSTDSVGFNWSDGETHSNGWTGGGEVGIGWGPFSAKGKAEKRYDNGTSHTEGGSRESSTTNGWSQGQTNTTIDQSTVDHSTATTDSTAVTKTDTKGGSQSNQEGSGVAATDAWTVSSSQTIATGFAGQVVANTYGVFYRQMARYTHRAFVLVYNKCGEGDVVGDITMQDYTWAPDLALGNQCPPMPQSNFPQPQCYRSPCDQ